MKDYRLGSLDLSLWQSLQIWLNTYEQGKALLGVLKDNPDSAASVLTQWLQGHTSEAPPDIAPLIVSGNVDRLVNIAKAGVVVLQSPPSDIATLPALSTIPVTTRPLLQTELIGRDTERAWLSETQGDRLITGHPGSGKTHLLASLAREGWGFFIVGDDMNRIAQEVQSRRAQVVILDDAHYKLGLLERLIHMRRETGASFTIAATSWPGGRDSVAGVLSIPASSILELPLLARDDMVRVIATAGLSGPNELVREIVNQAEGRPGLAVTLASLCLQGGVKDVALGDALSRSLLPTFERLVGPRSIELLAAFALGGDSGMRLDVVAQVLTLSLADVRVGVVGLAAGGAISEVAVGRGSVGQLAVRPVALRHVLVRDVFFSCLPRLPFDQLAEGAPSLSDVALTLLGARQIGADISLDKILSFLERAQSVEGWRAFAWSGEEESDWILANRPDLFRDLAIPLLYHSPHRTIPLLLAAAVGDNRDLGPHPDHPLRQLKDWVEDTEPDATEALTRRKTVLARTLAWIEANKDEDVGTHALSFAVWPKFERHSTDPGMGRTLTIRSGPLSLDRIHEVETLWANVVQTLNSMVKPSWRHILRVVENLAYPSHLSNGSLPSSVATPLRAVAGRMVADLVSVSRGHQGLLYRLNSIVTNLSLGIVISIDPVFDILFPSRLEYGNADSYERVEALHAAAVRRLATECAEQDSAVVVEQLLRYEREAFEVGITWPRYTPLFCATLARLSVSPNSWFRALFDSFAPPDDLDPFLKEAALREEPGWTELADACFSRANTVPLIASLLLTSQSPDARLLDKCLASLSQLTGLVEFRCHRGEIPVSTLRRLLEHEDPAVACAAVVGMWQGNRRSTVSPPLNEAWRSAIRRCAASYDELERSRRYINDTSNFWLAEILRSSPEVALDWLKGRLEAHGSGMWLELDAPDAAAADNLGTEQRISVLDLLPADHLYDPLIRHLVGDDYRVYQGLLNNKVLSDSHLVPLGREPHEPWRAMARLALAAGYSHRDIARATFRQTGVMTFWGEESAIWERWASEFRSLLGDPDEDLRMIGQIGLTIAENRRSMALAEEQQERIYGI